MIFYHLKFKHWFLVDFVLGEEDKLIGERVVLWSDIRVLVFMWMLQLSMLQLSMLQLAPACWKPFTTLCSKGIYGTYILQYIDDTSVR